MLGLDSQREAFVAGDVLVEPMFVLRSLLVVMNVNTVTLAARGFWRKRGVSEEHTR